jgi:hypothetical protein
MDVETNVSHVSLRFHSELLLALGAILQDDLTFGIINQSINESRHERANLQICETMPIGLTIGH